MSDTFDLAIVGSGFGGSLLAIIARRLGLSVVLLEKNKHPRFAIGESTTPLANLLLEELATRYELPNLQPLAKWGSWQTAYPEMACGLKRGFSFYHHIHGRPFSAEADRSDQLLVAASPHDGIADTHWYRADLDHFLVHEAQRLGVEYVDEVHLNPPSLDDTGVTLTGKRCSESISFRARFVVDGTGPRGFLHHTLGLPELSYENLPDTQALYTHFTGVTRLSDTLSDTAGEDPPYPLDNAAVHHVFDGGWIWALQFNNGITSAGVAARDDLAEEMNLEDGELAWTRLLQRFPTVAEQFAEAEPVSPFVHTPRLSYRSGIIIGERWMQLPSAAGFVDPLLSTGIPLTLLGITRLTEAIEQDWGTGRFTERLQVYAERTQDELKAASRLVSALYLAMDDFEVFTALTLLYFAAASYTESARRLGRPHLARSFLLHDHPVFGPRTKACIDRARHPLTPVGRRELLHQIREAIDPVNVAGLGDPMRRNWYPVDADEFLRSADKLKANRAEIDELLARSGFYGSPGAS